MQLETSLLDAWEAAAGEALPMRAVTLIGVAEPGTPRERIAAWPLGRCHRRLIAFRRSLFGRTMECQLRCGECGETLELSLDADSLLAEPDPFADTAEDGSERELSVADYRLRFRLPAPEDLAAAGNCSTVDEARALLARRCIGSIDRQGEPVTGEIPDQLIDAVSEQMAEADPFADMSFAVACPSCTHRWSPRFDILAYLWREVDFWARRLLGDIATLASAFGWSEGEILALSPGRRRRYLALAID